VAVILGANYARQLAMPAGTIPEWAVVIVVLAMSAALFGATTLAYWFIAGRRAVRAPAVSPVRIE
jgi:hypothetical protein